jgi:hypothetical protein
MRSLTATKLNFRASPGSQPSAATPFRASRWLNTFMAPCTLHAFGSGLIGRLAGRVGLPGATFCPLCHEYLGGTRAPAGRLYLFCSARRCCARRRGVSRRNRPPPQPRCQAPQSSNRRSTGGRASWPPAGPLGGGLSASLLPVIAEKRQAIICRKTTDAQTSQKGCN